MGETYGSLEVTAIVEKNSNCDAICTAKCVCGSEKEYRLSNLANGSTRSCGCLSTSNHRSAESLIGETISNMTLLEIVRRDNYGAAIGRFRCGHCGSKHKESVNSDWKRHTLLSCGCIKRKAKTQAEDHVGVKYNHLTLIKITGKNKRGQKTGLYGCSQCGNEKDEIVITNVVNLKTKSCGCLHNKAEDAIGTTWGNLKLLKITQKNNRNDRKPTKGIFECLLCGNRKEIQVPYVKKGITTNCGCSKHHGYTNHKINASL